MQAIKKLMNETSWYVSQTISPFMIAYKLNRETLKEENLYDSHHIAMPKNATPKYTGSIPPKVRRTTGTEEERVLGTNEYFSEQSKYRIKATQINITDIPNKKFTVVIS